MKRTTSQPIDNRSTSNHSERGSSLPLVAIGLALTVVMTLVLAGVASRVALRSRAQSAADAAALAGIADGEAGAEQFASQNGAKLERFSNSENVVSVDVSVDGAMAHAEAKRSLVLEP